jgi:hypothetical protein
MAKKSKLTELHYHEALDRSSILSNMIDNYLIQHPVCKLDKEVAVLVEEAATKLYQAYQLIGQRSIELFP